MGIVFQCFLCRLEFSRHDLLAMCYQKCFIGFRGRFFQIRAQLTVVNVAKPLYCRSKTGLEEMTPRCEMTSPGRSPSGTFGYISGSLGHPLLQKKRKKETAENKYFGESAKCLTGGYAYFRMITGCEATPAKWSLLERKTEGGQTESATFRTRL